MADIDGLRGEVERLERELSWARRALQAARENLAGVKVGDLVVGPTRRGNVKGRVMQVGFIGAAKPWVYVYPILKDGSEGKKRTCLYTEWEKADG